MDGVACRATAIEWVLPADLLLEIAARSDFRTLIRCTALCKLLRCDILDPSFIRRVTRPCILAYLQVIVFEEASLPPLFSLVHPATPDALLFFDDHLSSLMGRDAGGILREYYHVTSRGGLILLRRHRHVSISRPDMCVYDPITGHHTFLSEPPGIPSHRCVLLTAADGIGCSFLLFVATLATSSSAGSNATPAITVQTFTSTTNTWGPIMRHEGLITTLWLKMCFDDAVVLHGGVIHWTTRGGGKILTYDVRTDELGTLELPVLDTTTPNFEGGQLHLGSYSSPDGRKLLRLFFVVGFTISMWHHLPYGSWALETMIDTEEKLRSLDPGAPADQLLGIWLRFSSERSNVVLLHMYRSSLSVLLDMETEEMCVTRLDTSSMFLEIDMPPRLQGMKIFC